MITDLGIWTIVINLIALALAVQYSRSDTLGEALLWLVWDLTGLRFVWEKIRPLSDQEKKTIDYRPPATIAVWVFGLFSLYVAVYGLASQRYENAVDKIENRMNAFITQLAVVTNPEVRKVTFKEIAEIQQMKCPVKPQLYDPLTIFLSLVQNDNYDETVTVLTRTLEKYRDDLEGANLVGANLKGARLGDSNLEGARLEGANLSGAWLRGANLEGAYLEGTNLEGTVLTRANLKGARLVAADLEGAGLRDSNIEGAWLGGANLEGAYLEGSNLKGARLVGTNLKGARLLAANLEGASLWHANLAGASLEGANLKGTVLADANLSNIKHMQTDQLCSTRTLYQATMDSELENQVQQKCPEKLNEPK